MFPEFWQKWSFYLPEEIQQPKLSARANKIYVGMPVYSTSQGQTSHAKQNVWLVQTKFALVCQFTARARDRPCFYVPKLAENPVIMRQGLDFVACSSLGALCSLKLCKKQLRCHSQLANKICAGMPGYSQNKTIFL